MAATPPAAARSHRKKGLLLFPEFPPNSFWSYHYILRLIGRKATFPPFGLVTFAALLPDDWELELIDLNVTHLPEPLLRQKVADADVAFVSAMSIQKRGLVQLLNAARGLPTPFVLGGPLASSYREQILQPTTDSDQVLYRGLDLLVWGEAAPVVTELLERLTDATHHDECAPTLLIPQAVAAAEPGSRRYLNDRAIFKPLQPQRPPRWDLINVQDYQSMMLQTTAGCPFRCDFCDIVQFNGGFSRPKAPNSVGRELEAILATGFRGGVFTVDDNFVGAPAAMSGILDAMIEFQRAHDYPFLFCTQASVNLGTRELEPLLEKMKQAGFGSVFLGIENPDPAALRAMNKKQNVKVDIPASVRRIQAAGLEVLGGFILGGDEDGPSTGSRIVEFVTRNRIFTAMAGILTPVPHTPLYERLRTEGRLIAAEYSGNNTDDDVQFQPREFTPAQLRTSIHDVLQQLFVPAAAYRRAFDMIAAQRHHVYSRSQLQLRYLKAVVRSIWQQGIRRLDLSYFQLLWRAAWLDRKLARRWRARAQRLRRAARNSRNGLVPARERVGLEAMLRFAYEYAVRFRSQQPLADITERLTQARSRLHAGTLMPDEVRSIYRDARRYVRVCLRRHRFPGVAFTRALEAALKSLHYESVMVAIVEREHGRSS